MKVPGNVISNILQVMLPNADESRAQKKADRNRIEDGYKPSQLAYAAAPEISKLPKDWPARIATVAREPEVMAAIADYQQAAQNESFDDLQNYHRAYAMRAARRVIELRLAKAFVPELAALCLKENRAGFLAATETMHSPGEIEAHLYALIAAEAKTLPPPNYLANLTPYPLQFPPIEGEAQPTSADAATSPHSEDKTAHLLQRFHAIQEQSVAAYRQRKKGNVQPPTLTETVNSLWAETTWLRIKQPESPEFPHIFSVVSELVGDTKLLNLRADDAVAAKRGRIHARRLQEQNRGKSLT